MLVGKELGPYVVDKELGSGAMGTVYRARHKANGDRVALKLMSPALGTSDQARARFVRELEILKQLHHPGIVRYRGSGRYHGAPFFIMEFVDGESLDHVMARRGRMTWEEVVEMGAQLCQALQHAHDKGIIHRDLKPSNIMILRDGTVKLTDFGIAKDTDVTALTAANSTVGTAAYMSPEQCRGARDITAKSDLYSLGIVFYELLTGRKPFTAETAMEMFMQHANGTFPPPSKVVLEVPPWLNTLVCHLMEKAPEQRPYSASTVAETLQMVKEKVAAQQSAGIDTAKKRRIDRGPSDAVLDDRDKDAARFMLGKKRKKRKALPFYRKGWFTIAVLCLMAVVFATAIYFAFIRAPGAESLYAQAQELMKSDNDDKHREAREGPLADFLRYYPDHPKAAQVQAWADQVDRDVAETQMINRRNAKFRFDEDDPEEKAAEEKARLALDSEDIGKLDTAAQLWAELVRYKDDKEHPKQRPWGLVAEKYLKELQEVEKLAAQLRNSLQTEKILQKKHKGESLNEETALQALRAEAAEQWSDAQDTWLLLRNRTESDPKQRHWHLLAAKKVRELKNKGAS
jgi:serine/threonine-protein kinase